MHRSMRELQSYLLQMPTLKSLEFRPPLCEEYADFGSQDRAHVRDCFEQLDAKGMLVV